MGLLSTIAAPVAKSVGHDMPSYCDLETAFDSYSFVTSDGGLASFIRLRGVKNVPGDETSIRVFAAMEKVIKLGLERNSHSFSFIFENDPHSIEREVKDATRPVLSTLERLELDMADVYEDWQKKICEYCQTERNWLVVYTNPSAMDPDSLKREENDKKLYFKENGVPNLASAQNPFKLIEGIVNPHRSLCQNLLAEIKDCAYDAEMLTTERALYELKFCIDPETTDPSWVPTLTMNRRSPPVSLINEEDPADFWYPKIGKQLFSQDLQVVTDKDFPGEMVRVGSRYYSSMAMEEFPEGVENFSQLFVKIDKSVPWRVVIDIRPGGLQTKALTSMYTKVFGWMGNRNSEIKRGFDYLYEREKNGDRAVGITINATTWANTPRSLAMYESTLIRAFQSWGITKMVTRLGNPVLSWIVTLPGFTKRKCAVVTAAPLSEIMAMLPLQRPTSPWPEGAALTRSIDGKLMPIQPNSDLQTTWNDLFYAPPGSGKSVLVNTLTVSMILTPGLTALPRIAHLDIGPSASGVISMLKSALPEGRKHEAQYIKFAMSEQFSINPFDTELGCRKPTQIERDFLVNLLCIFATPAGKTQPYTMAAEMAGLVVDEIYKRLSDTGGGSPKIYERYLVKEVDDALEELMYSFDHDDPPSWWALVDMLFEAGKIHQAIIAQKYAVPVLEDLMVVIRSEAVRDLFSSSENSAVRVDNGQTLIDMYSTVISSARREYPVLSGITKFDVSDAKVVVLDLNDVAKGTGPEGKRRAALMYMLGRQATTKSFYLSEQMIEESPAIYHDYHLQRIKQIKGEKKAIIYDEFHNTGGLEALRKQVVSDMREGRKWNIRVALSSQLLNDFDDAMVSVATSIYILKAGTQDDVDEATRRFSLSAAAKHILGNVLSGPKTWGAPFLAYFQTKNGAYSQMFINTIGPVLNWALTTTAEDMRLRNALYDLLPASDARKLLAEVFPDGSCVPELKRRSAKADGADKSNPIDKLTMDLAELYYKKFSRI